MACDQCHDQRLDRYTDFCRHRLFLQRQLKERPGRFQSMVEMAVEALLGFFDPVTGDREKSKRFFPIAGTFFFFILFSNWMALLPGTGSIGVWHLMHGVPNAFPGFLAYLLDIY